MSPNAVGLIAVGVTVAAIGIGYLLSDFFSGTSLSGCKRAIRAWFRENWHQAKPEEVKWYSPMSFEELIERQVQELKQAKQGRLKAIAKNEYGHDREWQARERDSEEERCRREETSWRDTAKNTKGVFVCRLRFRSLTPLGGPMLYDFVFVVRNGRAERMNDYRELQSVYIDAACNGEELR